MMKPIYALVTLASLLLLWVGSGCLDSTGTDRDAAGAAGADFLLNAEPEAAQSVVDVRTRLEEKKEPTNVVVVGRIDGLGQPTWDPERAAFMLADLSLAPTKASEEAEHDETPKHDAENCPFCREKQKKALAGLALIQMVDPSGTDSGGRRPPVAGTVRRTDRRRARRRSGGQAGDGCRAGQWHLRETVS